MHSRMSRIKRSIRRIVGTRLLRLLSKNREHRCKSCSHSSGCRDEKSVMDRATLVTNSASRLRRATRRSSMDWATMPGSSRLVDLGSLRRLLRRSFWGFLLLDDVDVNVEGSTAGDEVALEAAASAGTAMVVGEVGVVNWRAPPNGVLVVVVTA